MSHDRIDRFTCDRCGKVLDKDPSQICLGTETPVGWLHVNMNNTLNSTRDFCSEACLVEYYERKTNG